MSTTTESNGKTILLRNDSGNVWGIQGELPNGEVGMVYDPQKPFTEKELKSPSLFLIHLADLDKRMKHSS